MKKLLITGMLALLGLTSYSQDTCEVATIIVYEKIELLEAVSGKHNYFLDTTMGIINVNAAIFNRVSDDTIYKVMICRKDELVIITDVIE